MEIKVINIGLDFGRYPAGRLAKDGPYSGEAFRDNLLIPALKKQGQIVEIEFDDARGLSSSFLEEVFGGLVRAGFKAEDVINRIKIKSRDHSHADEVYEYIKDQASASLKK